VIVFVRERKVVDDDEKEERKAWRCVVYLTAAEEGLRLGLGPRKEVEL